MNRLVKLPALAVANAAKSSLLLLNHRREITVKSLEKTTLKKLLGLNSDHYLLVMIDRDIKILEECRDFALSYPWDQDILISEYSFLYIKGEIEASGEKPLYA